MTSYVTLLSFSHYSFWRVSTKDRGPLIAMCCKRYPFLADRLYTAVAFIVEWPEPMYWWWQKAVWLLRLRREEEKTEARHYQEGVGPPLIVAAQPKDFWYLIAGTTGKCPFRPLTLIPSHSFNVLCSFDCWAPKESAHVVQKGRSFFLNNWKSRECNQSFEMSAKKSLIIGNWSHPHSSSSSPSWEEPSSIHQPQFFGIVLCAPHRTSSM